MRGKVNFVQSQAKPDRITPAYAGKSQLSTASSTCNQDHPRLCGEKCPALYTPERIAGSPPPMRGKECQEEKRIAWNRITPAYAGKRAQFNFCFVCTEDHPRLCGEKFWVNLFCNAVVGSPPPMRGKVGSAKKVSGLDGITPAYAGKRPWWYRHT